MSELKPSTFAEDVAASWNRDFQRPASEAMRQAVVWPDIPTSPVREIKSKNKQKEIEVAEHEVTKEQADQVLEAIKAKWPESDGWSHIDGPFLHDADHEEQPEGCWSISWEGAPEDWTSYASMEFQVPGVFLEPMTSWCLGLFPAGGSK